jgi:glycine cleavage system H protein
MKTYQGLKYSKDHEWVRLEDGKAYVGITNFAQLALGDIVFVDLPKKGAKLKAGDTLGVVESVKTASDVFTPVSGEVIEVNDALADAPENLNQEPYENHLAVLKLENAAELDGLMDEAEYGKYCVEEA